MRKMLKTQAIKVKSFVSWQEIISALLQYQLINHINNFLLYLMSRKF